MSDKNEENDQNDDKSLIDTQKEITQNVRLWYKTKLYFEDQDTISDKLYKVFIRVVITLIMIAFSPILFVVLVVALIGAS